MVAAGEVERLPGFGKNGRAFGYQMPATAHVPTTAHTPGQSITNASEGTEIKRPPNRLPYRDVPLGTSITDPGTGHPAGLINCPAPNLYMGTSITPPADDSELI